ncbi:MAG: hypothetical protein ABWY92_22695 [Xanthobacteraceae bacterium]
MSADRRAGLASRLFPATGPYHSIIARPGSGVLMTHLTTEGSPPCASRSMSLYARSKSSPYLSWAMRKLQFCSNVFSLFST